MFLMQTFAVEFDASCALAEIIKTYPKINKPISKDHMEK